MLHQCTIWISDTHAGNNAAYLQKLLNNPHRDYPYLIFNCLDLGQIKIGLTYLLTSDERVQQVVDKAQDSLLAYIELGNDDRFSNASVQGEANAEDSAWLFFARQ